MRSRPVVVSEVAVKLPIDAHCLFKVCARDALAPDRKVRHLVRFDNPFFRQLASSNMYWI